uniref:GTPase n=1 Tax=Aeromicrobium sp. TaxID=1871063 RepID=UPI0028AF6A5B
MSGLDDRIAALRSALDAGADVIDPGHADPATATFAHAAERLELSTQHTVVVLAGSTGSGKSSLFNRLTGLELAEVGYLRPTTANALACAWGPVGATELLDWIGVARRDQISRHSLLDAPRDDAFEGLVLLDLPDHDSIVEANQQLVDHVAQYADLFVWVLDPQKYADAAIHSRYLQPLATHKDASVVVLNQSDRLSETDLKIAVNDLEHILEREGFAGVPVIATSATSGTGIADLRAEIARRIKSKSASQARLVADVRLVARQLAKVGGTEPVPGLDRPTRDGLVETFIGCAGVPQIADAVEESMSRRAMVATDWPLIGWVGRMRHDPLRELGFGRSARDAVAGTM